MILWLQLSWKILFWILYHSFELIIVEPSLALNTSILLETFGSTSISAASFTSAALTNTFVFLNEQIEWIVYHKRCS